MTALIFYDVGIALTLTVGLALLLSTRDTRVAVGRLRWVVVVAGINATLLAFSESGASTGFRVALINSVAVALIEVVRRFGFRSTDDTI
ncbi:MAG: hypothetical protein Q8S43_09120 [Actinomycetota bacterium]|nr:hypothetical protein [Actinomycetota bacterium]MDP3631090.1 hypothetical protein [Actinomycetota bacterium]